MAIDWNARARRLLKAELAKRDINFVELSERLKEIGIKVSSQNLSNKIARGSFSAPFMLQVFAAIGSDRILIGDSSTYGF